MIRNRNLINESIAIDSKDLKAIDSKALENKTIEEKARILMTKLKADIKYLRFYCKCFYELPEGTIAYIAEGAMRANYPANYFAKSARVEMEKVK